MKDTRKTIEDMEEELCQSCIRHIKNGSCGPKLIRTMACFMLTRAQGATPGCDKTFEEALACMKQHKEEYAEHLADIGGTEAT